MTIAQIAYIASGYETLMAERMHQACVAAAVRLGLLDQTRAEYEWLKRSSWYRAQMLGGAYA